MHTLLLRRLLSTKKMCIQKWRAQKHLFFFFLFPSLITLRGVTFPMFALPREQVTHVDIQIIIHTHIDFSRIQHSFFCFHLFLSFFFLPLFVLLIQAAKHAFTIQDTLQGKYPHSYRKKKQKNVKTPDWQRKKTSEKKIQL